MKQGLILCEGETDKVLISSYLGGRRGWKYTEDQPIPFSDERISRYKKNGGQYLNIWAVDGHDFRSAMKKVTQRQKMVGEIDRVAIVTDHDDAEAESDRLNEILSVLRDNLPEPAFSMDPEMYINRWSEISYQDDYQTEIKMQFCYLLVPKAGQGALETFMMQSLMESSPEREEVIRQSREFIDHFQSEVYLKTRRDRVKAKLGVSMAIFSPDRVFTTMKELVESVDWSRSVESIRQFELLEEF
jgi:hypothetical protein